MGSIERRIVEILQNGEDAVLITLDNGEQATVHRFGSTTYSTVSENLNKKTLVYFKIDCLLFDFCAKKLSEKWLIK